MTTFSEALASVGPFDPAWLIPRERTYFQYTYMEVNPEIIKPASTMSSGQRNAVTPLTTSITNDVAKPGSASKSSVWDPKIEKSTSITRAPVTPKAIPKAASTLKHVQLGSKIGKAAPNSTRSSQTHQSTASPREATRPLQDPSAPPPKKGSFLELMSRKASDMPELPRKREPTGKQIKEAAKAAKRELFAARKKKPYSIHTDPHLRHLSAKEKNAMLERRRQVVHQQTKKKIPRRAYNGTGATSRGSSQGATADVQTSVPLERSVSLQSASSSNNSSNNMESGYMDVVEEESRAAMTAKQEDENEARLEAMLREAKERRRVRETRATSGQT